MLRNLYLAAVLLFAQVVGQVCYDDYGSGFYNTSQTFLSNPLVSSDNQNKQRFGKAVDIQGNRAVICAYLTDSTLLDTGKCYVFVNFGSGWTEVQNFFGPNPGASDYFGYTVDMDGNWLIVGAPQDTISSTNYAGSATIYYWNGVAYVSPVTVTKPVPVALDFCGTAVGIQNASYALIGCIGDDTVAADGGLVYIFKLVSAGVVTYNGTLSAPSNANDNFGSALAIDNSHVVIGAAAYDGVGSNSGKAYLYDLTNDIHTLRYSFVPTPLSAGDEFGTVIGIAHPYILVGAPFRDVGFSNAGAAFLFYDTGPSATQLSMAVNPVNPGQNSYFGSSVALFQQSDARLELLIGAYNGRALASSNPVGVAQLHIYEITTGQLRFATQFLATDGANGDYFGGALAISNRTFLIGAERENTPTGGATSGGGTAYIFDASTCTNQTGICYTLSFDVDAVGIPLPAGTLMASQYSAIGVVIINTDATHPAILFDSSSPTCVGGTSIGTPSNAFGGPGVGAGGNLTNSLDLDKLLIMQNVVGGCTPEVVNTSASFLMNFTQVINPSLISFVDGRASSALPTNISLYYDYGMTVLLGVVTLPFIGTDSVQTLSLSAYPSTRMMRISFGGPGGIASFSYCLGNATAPASTPTPSPTPSPSPTPAPPTPSPVYLQCDTDCAAFNGTSQLDCDQLQCNCSFGIVTCDVYTSGENWSCVEPLECCANPTNCTTNFDCCGGYVCYQSVCGLTPSPQPPPPQPSCHVCNNIVYAGGEESGCTDLCNKLSGDTSFLPWEITGVSLDIKCQNQNGWEAATKQCWFDLIGNAFENGVLSTDIIGMTVGEPYTVLLNYGTSSEASQVYNLYINLDYVLAHTSVGTPGINNWILVTYTFTATATTHHIDIYTDSGFDEMGAYVDSPRIYACLSQTKPWCLESHPNITDCTSGATAVDYQANPCGCGVQTLQGDCVNMLWNFSVAEQCAPDNGEGSFGTCESHIETTSITRAYIGECVESTTPSYLLYYQTPNATNGRRTIPTTYNGYPVLDNLLLYCGQCIPIPGTVLSAKVNCVFGTIQYFIDTACVYPVSGSYAINDYATIEYEMSNTFILAAGPNTCEEISLSTNCSNATLINSTDVNLCWSETTNLPAGTFYNTTYRSFKILCPARELQFYLTTTCTGPIQFTSVQTGGCRVPVNGINISVNDNLVCGCSPPTPSPAPAPAPNPAPVPSPVPVPNPAPVPLPNPAPSPSPSPSPTPSPTADACFREYENVDCTSLLYSQNITFNTCNAIEFLAQFGAQTNGSLITTYLSTNCTTITNVFGFLVCIQLSSPYEHSGIFSLGDCNGPEITPSPSPTPSSSPTQQSSDPVQTSESQATSADLSSSQPSPSGNEFYLPFYFIIYQQ